jgi:hypothetical protein
MTTVKDYRKQQNDALDKRYLLPIGRVASPLFSRTLTMSGIEQFVYKLSGDFRKELAPAPYLEGGLPLFTELPRALLF